MTARQLIMALQVGIDLDKAMDIQDLQPESSIAKVACRTRDFENFL
jgi:hypothetical protein